VGVRVVVAYSRNKLTLRTRLRNLHLRSHFLVYSVSFCLMNIDTALKMIIFLLHLKAVQPETVHLKMKNTEALEKTTFIYFVL